MLLRITYLIVFYTLYILSFANDFEFIPNQGQWKKDIICKAYIPNGILIISDESWTFRLFDYKALSFGHGNCQDRVPENTLMNAHNIRYTWNGSESFKNPRYLSKKRQYSNFYHGKNPKQWTSKVEHFEQVRFNDLYKGIDLHLYSINGTFKYDYIIHPGAEHNQIEMIIDGADSLGIDNNELVIYNSIDIIKESIPEIYLIEKTKSKIDGRYSLNGNIIKYQLETDIYQDTLVIDPSLVFSTYSGSYVPNWGFTATHDLGTNTYSGGVVFDAIVTDTFPITPGAFQINWGGGPDSGYDINYTDAVIQKYNNQGQLLFSTFLGGYGGERPHSLTINNKNELIIMGTTSAADFPVTPLAYDTSANGNWDIFVSKLDPTGSAMLASTYMGGSENDGVNISNSYGQKTSIKFNYADDSRGDISVDENFNIYIASCTKSGDFPTSAFAYQKVIGGNQDAIAFKFNDDLSQLMYSTFLGGNEDDAAYSIVYKDQITFITGGTKSSNYPVTPNAIQSIFAGDSADAFVSTLNLDGSQLLASTFWGTYAYDQAYFVQLDDESNVYLLGQTKDTSNYFLRNEQYYIEGGSQFISKLSTSLDTVLFSMTFGSGSDTPDIVPSAFLVDVCNKIFVSGWGGDVNGLENMMDLPITADAFQDSTDGSDYYLMVLEGDASALIYASYIGSPSSNEHVDGGTSRFDKRGIIHQAVCAGCANDSNFPTTIGAWSNTNNSTSNCNTATFQYDFEFPSLNTDFSVDQSSGCAPLSIQFKSITEINDSSLVSYQWNFGDGITDTTDSLIHTYQDPGEYYVELIVNDPSTCNIRDTIKHLIRVISDSSKNIADLSMCGNSNIQIGILPSPDSSIQYHWTPELNLSDPYVANPVAFPDSSTNYQLLITDGSCTDTIHQNLFVLSGNADSLAPAQMCLFDTLSIGLQNTNNFSYYWLGHPSLEDSNSSMTNVYPDSTTTFSLIAENYFCADTLLQKVIVERHIPWNFQQDTTICAHESIQIGFQDIYGINYNWTPTNFLNNPNFAQPITSPDTNITYYLGMSQMACKAADSIQIIVLPKPDLQISSDKQICYGDTAILSASGGLTYFWWPNNELSDSTSNSPKAYPLVTKYFKVHTLNSHLCSDIDSVHIIVDPDLKIDAGSNDSICEGMAATLQANLIAPGFPGMPAPYAYQWSPTSSLNYSHLANPTAQPLSSTTYYVTITDGHLCSHSDSINIHISPYSPGSLKNDTSICMNDSIILGFIDTSSGLNYIWQPSNGLSDDSNSLSWAKPDTNTLFKLFPNDTTCQKVDSIYIQVLQLPFINAGVDTILCNGDTIQLNSTPGNTINWSPSIGLNDSSIHNPSCFVEDTQSYVVNIIDNNQCKNFDSITIYALYTPQINAGNDTNICYNTGLFIGMIDSIDQNYFWTPTNYLLDSNTPLTYCKPDTSISYILQHINTQCSSPDTININIFDTPNIIITSDTSACEKDSFQLFAHGGTSYIWNPDSLIDLPNSDSPKIYINDSLIVVIEIIDTNLCSIIDSINIDMIPSPIFDLGADTQICTGDTILIGFPDSSVISFSWNDSSYLSVGNQSLVWAFPDSSQYFHIIPSDLRCVEKDSLWIEVNSLPNLIINSDTQICELDSILINASGASIYLWESLNFISDTNSSSCWSYPDLSTFYYLTGIDTNNCTSYDSFYVEMLHTPYFVLGADTNICRGDSLLLGIQDSLISIINWVPDNIVSQPNLSFSYVKFDTSQLLTLMLESGICSYSDSIYINTEIISPTSSFEFTSAPNCNGMSISLQNNSVQHFQSYWKYEQNTQESENAIFEFPYNSSAQIELISISQQLCKDSITSIITVPDLKSSILKKTPNVFTPNQDGNNDCFYLFSPNSELSECGEWAIYNRWGNKVFESSDPSACWDGTLMNGDVAKEGVYFYIFTLKNWSITNHLQLIK